MLIAIAAILVIGVILYTLSVRAADLPESEPESPTKYLEERKASIYENLRDLQFEYRLGKLSDADYQQTKQDLQKELAAVLAEVDRLKGLPAPAAAAPAPAPKPKARKNVCPHCKAEFALALKFCGECGKPMEVER
jgi:hypothetical protein